MRTGFSPTGLIAIPRGLTPDEAVLARGARS
jgi:hypothetical protein